MFKFNVACQMLKTPHFASLLLGKISEKENRSFKLDIELHPFFRFIVVRKRRM